MLRYFKTIGCLALLALGVRTAHGFSLMGPFNQSWQSPAIGYNLPGDIGGPHNLGEEYRWNTPTIYYAYNQNFTDYFASNGVWAVDQAVAILNNLTNYSRYSQSLTEIPTQSRRVNSTANTLHLIDLKTQAMFLMLEELGLTDPVRYVFTLHTREVQPGRSCPFMIYGVIKWSFDPANWQPSSYINGVLYSYIISEICSGANPLGVTVPFPVDPLAVEHYPATYEGVDYGAYITGLTRDDVGGLRYIYQKTNINWEAMSSDSVLLYTNFQGGSQLLLTSNMNILAAEALTNNAAGLQTLHPDLSILATTNIFTNIWVTNLTAYFTNYPLDPYGTPPHFVIVTNRVLTVQNWYHHTFGNLYTVALSNGVWVPVLVPDVTTQTGKIWMTIETTMTTNSPYDPYGTPPRTNVTQYTYRANGVLGEYFILSSNTCGVANLTQQAKIVTQNTNFLLYITNITTIGNASNVQYFYQDVVDYFTNFIFTYYPIECVVTNVTLRQGIDKFTFVKTQFDSISGRYYQPITNLYTLVTVTNNGQLKTNWYKRLITKPDFLFTATDITPGLADRTVTAANFKTNNENLGLAGPGNIDPGPPTSDSLSGHGAVEIGFNKVGPLIRNYFSTNFILNGLSESTSTTNFIWGSFDGTTNAPIVYPNGNSIMNMEAQILFQIITPFLPEGIVGGNYPPAQIQATGGSPPYVFTWSAGVPQLPPGLTLSPAGVLSGRPTMPGTFVFNVTATGTDGRSTIRTLQVVINP
jgi:hypothetical protein